ncbi:MAG: hypothetical protein JWL85_432 [Candidatus Saccharibacteria bacterium]|nr:hypothetical protein [Candidatus Saccharibacteria bacterium]
MAKLGLSSKRLQIDKANTTVTIAVAAATFVVIFSLFACRALLSTRSYQAKVINEKETAVRQLKANIEAVDKLVISYKEFSARPDNIINGISTGTGDRDGDNAKITLDALPSKYDFPALVSSIEKLVSQNNFRIVSISGIDQEVEQKTDGASPSPQPVELPFKATVSGAYDPMQELIKVFDQSIRPIQPQIVTFTAQGENKEVQLEFDAKTYYLPEKTLSITTKEVK